MSVIVNLYSFVPTARNQQSMLVVVHQNRYFLLVRRIGADQQTRKEVNRNDLTLNRTNETFTLSIIQLNNRDVRFHYIFVVLGHRS